MTQQDQPKVERATDEDGVRDDAGVDTLDHVEDLIERDPLIMLFGDHARARIVMAMLDSHPYPQNPASIVEQAQISRQSWYRHKEPLIETGLIKQVSKAGNSPMYAIPSDEEDKRVEWLQKLRDWTGAYMRDERLTQTDSTQ